MQTVIYIKADKEVKENAARTAKELGLSLSDVINASLRNFIRTREITFSHTPQMTPELEKLIAKVEVDIKNKRNLVGPFKTAKEANNYLDSL
ncbi:MAG: type II toxin-antitoxin system RelB/DinJ family antitoxin [Candidatus Levybacteria bacterium]|nr:type II toxin-antitoxin system RelB/DinJ family antitoxin [Candidatus Levybacteria bacterium]